MVSAAAYDPGGMSDWFTMLTGELTQQKILLTGARSWSKERDPNFQYTTVFSDIARINQKFKFKYHICEKNNQGETAIQILRNQYALPIIGVTTSNNLISEKVKAEGKTVDKNKIVAWINIFREKGIIEFPQNITPELQDMLDQLENFGEKRPGKYEALSGHDDYVSNLITLVHFAIKKILDVSFLRQLLFDGAVSSIDAAINESESAQEKAELFAKDLLGRKGTKFDNMDVTLPG